MNSIQDADLRQLADLESAERAFVSCYLCPADDQAWVVRREKAISHLLEDQPEDLEHFRESMRLLNEWLDNEKLEHPAVCVFSCFALDFVEGYSIPVEVPRLLRAGPAPLIRPLAEIGDEYEDFVFVAADNESAAIHFVSTTAISSREQIKGDIKHDVKKGGWSQKRYQRRRENEQMHYAKEIAQQLEALHDKRPFRRLVVLGSQEIRDAIVEQLSARLTNVLVGDGAVDLTDDETALLEEARTFIDRAEQDEERSVFKRIRAELLSGGLADAGPVDVWYALANGRADEVILVRDLKIAGLMCRQCENVTPHKDDPTCDACKSNDTFPIDLVDECVRQAQRTSASVEFVDAFDQLNKLGGIAAQLRY
jgi:peptide subunit release factor 1 (eRF1)